jgi:DNA-binding transcriptional MerR regulator
VEPHVLRYWETKFSKLNPKRVSGNQRKYTRNDLELLYEIVHLLYYDGYTLDGAERKLRAGLHALKAERDLEKTPLDEVEENLPSDIAPTQPIELFPALGNSVTNQRTLLLQEIKSELIILLQMLK